MHYPLIFSITVLLAVVALKSIPALAINAVSYFECGPAGDLLSCVTVTMETFYFRQCLWVVALVSTCGNSFWEMLAALHHCTF